MASVARNKRMEQHQRRVIRVSRTNFVVGVVLLLIALAWLSGGRMVVDMMSFVGTEDSTPAMPSIMDSVGVAKSDPDYYPYPRYQDDPSITDTREFLKVNYSATIQTRDVPRVVTEVKNIIKGADGRIDDLYSSDKSGRIGFVVAKSKFEAFRAEVEALTNKKLYVESISSRNLLGQRQNIEGRMSTIVGSLDGLTAQRTALVTAHTQTVSDIQRELTRISTELTAVRTQIADTSNAQILTSLRSEEAALVDGDAVERQRLSDENNSYAAKKQNLDAQIANYTTGLATVTKEDRQFTDNIETVNGSVYVRWVSLWELAHIFSPVSPIIIIVLLVIAVWFYLRHFGFIPRVEWV